MIEKIIITFKCDKCGKIYEAHMQHDETCVEELSHFLRGLQRKGWDVGDFETFGKTLICPACVKEKEEGELL